MWISIFSRKRRLIWHPNLHFVWSREGYICEKSPLKKGSILNLRTSMRINVFCHCHYLESNTLLGYNMMKLFIQSEAMSHNISIINTILQVLWGRETAWNRYPQQLWISHQYNTAGDMSGKNHTLSGKCFFQRISVFPILQSFTRLLVHPWERKRSK